MPNQQNVIKADVDGVIAAVNQHADFMGKLHSETTRIEREYAQLTYMDVLTGRVPPKGGSPEAKRAYVENLQDTARYIREHKPAMDEAIESFRQEIGHIYQGLMSLQSASVPEVDALAYWVGKYCNASRLVFFQLETVAILFMSEADQELVSNANIENNALVQKYLSQ